ncbi:MAG: PIN domain-containing protein [Phormidesmis sp.]
MTNKDIENLLQQYFSKGLLVDTNILLLFFVGSVSRERINRFRRTEQFSSLDYDLLVDLFRRFKVIATTPNILTEISNLINQLDEPDRSECYKVFASGIAFLEETYLPSRDVASSYWPFSKYGLTDCGIAELAQNKYLVLTDDLRVTRYFNDRGIDTVNFNNLRYHQL